MMQMVPNPGRAELPSPAPTPRRKTASGLSADVKRLRQEELTRRCHPPPSRPHAHLHRAKHLVIVIASVTETCPISTEGWTRCVHFVREGGGGGRRTTARRS